MMVNRMNKSKYIKSLKILNLTAPAKLSAIKKSYRKLVKIYHPDKYQNSTEKEIAQEKFKKINDAYHYLIDNYDENFTQNNIDEEKTTKSFDFDNDKDDFDDADYSYYRQYQSYSSPIDDSFDRFEKQRIMPIWAKIIIYFLFNSIALVIHYLFL